MNVKGFYDAIGGSYDTALTRLMKDSMIERFVLKFPNDKSFSELESAVAAGDWDAAFSASHTLKGVSLNLAFAELGKAAETLTDALRPQNVADRNPAVQKSQFDAVKSAYDTVICMIEAFKDA